MAGFLNISTLAIIQLHECLYAFYACGFDFILVTVDSLKHLYFFLWKEVYHCPQMLVSKKENSLLVLIFLEKKKNHILEKRG